MRKGILYTFSFLFAWLILFSHIRPALGFSDDTRTYLKIVVPMKKVPIMCPHAAVARRPMGTDSETFSRGAHPGTPPGAQAHAHARRVGNGALDSEHGRAVAHAAAVLSQLQNGPSPVPAVVRTRGVARDSHAPHQ